MGEFLRSTWFCAGDFYRPLGLVDLRKDLTEGMIFHVLKAALRLKSRCRRCGVFCGLKVWFVFFSSPRFFDFHGYLLNEVLLDGFESQRSLLWYPNGVVFRSLTQLT